MFTDGELIEIFRDFTVVSIPTKTNFRGITTREVALFKGSAGWSEFGPFLEYGDEEAKAWLRAAIEGAYCDWPTAFRQSIPVNATLPKVSENQVAGILSGFPGCHTVKIKIDDFVNDSALIEATLDYLPDAKIRLDVNGGWSLQEALLNLHDYHLRFGKVFEYVEQPCLDFSDLVKLKREIPIKIAVDESIRKNLAADHSNFSEGADVAIIKWAPSGGMSAALHLIEEIQLPAVVSSALDTGIGISHGVALSAALPDLSFACGLGTVALLTSDIVQPAQIPVAGELSVNRCEPDSELLNKYEAAPERTLWWHNRVERIWNSGLREEIEKAGWVK